MNGTREEKRSENRWEGKDQEAKNREGKEMTERDVEEGRGRRRETEGNGVQK